VVDSVDSDVVKIVIVVETTLILVRNAATDWTRDGRLLGRREMGLSAEGRLQADAIGRQFSRFEITEVLSSPLPRAVETAEPIAMAHQLEVARDPRLNDLHAGAWEGKHFATILETPEYRELLRDPTRALIPGAESPSDACERMVSSVTQALNDNEFGATIVIVSHAQPLRLLLTHYLGMDIAHFHRLRLSHCGASILRFSSDQGAPRILAMNTREVESVLR
jgi:alpha-ribazole phosphatase